MTKYVKYNFLTRFRRLIEKKDSHNYNNFFVFFNLLLRYDFKNNFYNHHICNKNGLVSVKENHTNF